MQLRSLNDQELEKSFHHVVASERKIIHLVILHVQEISRRKLFLAKGYSSLFDYLTEDIKYSTSAAQRRIEAVRLMSAVPEVSVELQLGRLNLSQIGNIQSAVKKAEALHQTAVTPEKKSELVKRIANCNGESEKRGVHANSDKDPKKLQPKCQKPLSTAATQQLCAEFLDIPVVEPEKISTQKNKSKRVQLTLSEEQFAKFEKLKNQLAHKHFQTKRTQSMADVLETLFDELLKPTDTIAASAMESANKAIAASAMESAIKPEAHSNQKTEWKSLTPKRKQTILRQDQCCQYEDYETGKVCGSRFNLQVDHIVPKAFGSKNDPGNLRVLCREHNLFRNQQNRLQRTSAS